MKLGKLLLVATLTMGSSAAMAVAPGGSDCGWGNLLMEGKSGVGSHILATVTNNTSGNATFGMTSGTNGCATDGVLTYGGASMISGIMDEFSGDVARGHGEALDAVAVMLGVNKADRAHFAQVVHENFSTIFSHEKVTAQEVTASLTTVLRGDARLAKYAA